MKKSKGKITVRKKLPLLLFLDAPHRFDLTKRCNAFLDKNYHLIFLFLFILIFVTYYSIASFLRYDHFYTGRYDLGNMTQTVWNTAHGRFFEFTSPDVEANVSRLAYHADFILILFAPFYWIYESPKVLLFSQALIVGLGAVFVYLLGVKIIKNQNISLAFAFSYLINPSVGWAVLFDFHPIVLATTFLLGTTYFFLTKKYVWFGIFVFLSVITKEEVWLISMFFGSLLFFWHKKRMLGGMLFFLSLGMFYYLIWHAIPQAASSHGHFALSYFEEGGSSPTALITQTILNPVSTIETVTSPDRIGYLNALFSPLGYVSLLFPFWLFMPLADFVLNFLSDKEELHEIYYHYTASITPFLFVSALYGVNVLKRYVKSWLFISVFIILSALFGAYRYGPLPGSKEPNVEMFGKQSIYHTQIQAQLKKIPTKNSVASSNEIGAQLSHRKTIYSLGSDVTLADYVAFFTRDPDKNEEAFNTELIRELDAHPEFERWYGKNGLTIYRKY